VIIDSHAHVIAPESLYAFRAHLLASGGFHRGGAAVTDAEVAETAAKNIRIMDGVGTDVQLLSPRPFQLGHSMEPAHLVDPWIGAWNDTIARTVALHPHRFAGVAALPITPGAPVDRAFGELHRTIEELGFVGVMVNPDPSEGKGSAPTLGDRYWYPLYEKLVGLDVPMQVHSAACFSGRETYSEHFITEESIAILTLLRSRVFQDFPDLRVIISHGGGSVPYQLGRWQAERQHPVLGEGPGSAGFEVLLRQLYFDSVLHYPPSLDLLLRTVGADRVLFGTERPGSGTAHNPATGRDFDDIKPIIESFEFLGAVERDAVFESNARRVFPRLTLNALHTDFVDVEGDAR